jgi:anti-sigma B factor antagonist
MEIREHAAGAVMVYELSGRLTLESFGALKERVRQLADQGGRSLVLDLRGVSYIDSIGVSELVRSHVILDKRGGRLVLAAIPGQVAQLLSVTRLDRIFDQRATQADAVKSFRPDDQ